MFTCLDTAYAARITIIESLLKPWAILNPNNLIVASYQYYKNNFIYMKRKNSQVTKNLVLLDSQYSHQHANLEIYILSTAFSKVTNNLRLLYWSARWGGFCNLEDFDFIQRSEGDKDIYVSC